MESKLEIIVSNILAEDAKVITYRPKLNALTGSVSATILLQQIFHWWKVKNGKPFYKFKEPCGHNGYSKGDSWVEDLGMGKSEFETALKKIAVKITKGVNKKEALKTSLVIYWTDTNRLTWYQLNETLYIKKVSEIYLGKVENSLYIENQEKAFTSFTENTNTKNTNTENTIMKIADFKKSVSPILIELSRIYISYKERHSGVILPFEAYFGIIYECTEFSDSEVEDAFSIYLEQIRSGKMKPRNLLNYFFTCENSIKYPIIHRLLFDISRNSDD